MSEELEIFLEDCDDQLQMMENALVDMQNSGATEDSIGAIFRAAHTIKGSAGMFGFDNIVAFTHIVENLF
ncbi:MAG: Hpt domain-containing protein, partial [Sulfurimonas sp.]|nr:Hpt domain-containing protein [Sulfurimonas sp.]